MSRSHLEANDEQRHRLTTLVSRLDEAALTRVVHENWTIAAKFAHLAFWDRFALLFLERWFDDLDVDDGTPDWHEHAMNDALLPEWLALRPEEAARLAIEAASAVDAKLTALDQAGVDKLAEDALWLLRRHVHRSLHLDEIESALAPG